MLIKQSRQTYQGKKQDINYHYQQSNKGYHTDTIDNCMCQVALVVSDSL